VGQLGIDVSSTGSLHCLLQSLWPSHVLVLNVVEKCDDADPPSSATSCHTAEIYVIKRIGWIGCPKERDDVFGPTFKSRDFAQTAQNLLQVYPVCFLACPPCAQQRLKSLEFLC